MFSLVIHHTIAAVCTVMANDLVICHENCHVTFPLFINYSMQRIAWHQISTKQFFVVLTDVLRPQITTTFAAV